MGKREQYSVEKFEDQHLFPLLYALHNIENKDGMKPHEVEAAEKIKHIIIGCHFSRQVVEDLIYLLHCSMIIPK